MKNVYIVQAVEKTRRIIVDGAKAEIDLTNMADGCLGVCLAFGNKRKAERYAGKYGVIHCQESCGKIRLRTYMKVEEGEQENE